MTTTKNLYAVDLFCGAGGFSEGILQAGFNILFSSDRSEFVQKTYMHRHEQLGLIQDQNTHFELTDIRELNTERILECINKLPEIQKKFSVGDVDVIFGGPPCQGFSRLGKRDAKDPRNMLFHEYLRIISGLKPKYVVMENVSGFMDMQMLDFPSILPNKEIYQGQHLVKNILQQELVELGYTVLEPCILNASDFGVPQSRNRAIFLAYRTDMRSLEYPTKLENKITVREALANLNNNMSSEYGLDSEIGRTPGNKDGKSVARTNITNIENSKHSGVISQRFGLYKQGENTKNVIKRLRIEGANIRQSSTDLFFESVFIYNESFNMRIIKKIMKLNNIYEKKFEGIDKEEERSWFRFTNKSLSKLFCDEDMGIDIRTLVKKFAKRLNIETDTANTILRILKRELNEVSSDEIEKKLIIGDIDEPLAEALLTKKAIRQRINGEGVAPTVVTVADDFIHPYENRTITVREMARFQSFDDSFEFIGKRTTGGLKRRTEVPQQTQVGNAVPPLLAKAIATSVKIALLNS